MTSTSTPKPKSGLSPVVICTIATILALIGAFVAIGAKSPLLMFLFLLPAVIYEVIRTEPGASTKFSSILLLIIIVLEIILIVFGINYDLAKFFGEEEKYVAGYTLPLGDVKVFGPLLTAILSTVLVFRTYGTYTKWLSIIIALGSLVAVFLISPAFFQQALKLIINGLFDRMSYGF
jgi:hypothetical protein